MENPMKNLQRASTVRNYASLLICVAGTAMAHTPIDPDANALTSNMAEHIQVYRQLHGILSHPRCIIAPGTHQYERFERANIVEQHDYAGRIIEKNTETAHGPPAGKCQTALPRTTPIEPCIYGESTASSGNGTSAD
jgi:hypothetical protein